MDIPLDPVEARKVYVVTLDSIRDDIEVPDSVAIKFSILTKTPLAKVKHLMRRLPAQIWRGEGLGRAQAILGYIEEAGGKGSVQETTQAEPVRAPIERKERPTCRYCGYPMREGDTFCDFCRTPVDAPHTPEAPKAGDSPAAGAPCGKPRSSIPPKRLIVYGVILLAAIILAVALR